MSTAASRPSVDEARLSRQDFILLTRLNVIVLVAIIAIFWTQPAKFSQIFSCLLEEEGLVLRVVVDEVGRP